MTSEMAVRTAGWVVDQQLQSPLFGKLPAEIRDGIFALVLEEYCDKPIRHNFRIRYDHDGEPDDDGVLDSSVESARFTDSEGEADTDEEADMSSELVPNEAGANAEDDAQFTCIEFGDSDSDESWSPSSDEEDKDPAELRPWVPEVQGHLLTWLRPGTLGMPKIDISLLLTCRRAYLETSDIPAQNATLHIWANDAPRIDKSEAYDATSRLYSRLSPRHRNRITTAHLHCSELFKTGPRGLWGLATGPQALLRRIEVLRVSVAVPRHAFPMFWDPWHTGLSEAGPSMVPNWAATEDFGRGEAPPETPDAEWEPPVRWGAFAWADVFRYLPSLRTFTMDFDGNARTQPGVGRIAEWAARVWRFPLGPRPDDFTYLSAQGSVVERTSWRGPPCFPLPCNHCPDGHHEQGLGEHGECPWSATQIVLLEKGVGERMHSWTVTWTARVGRKWVPPVRVGGGHTGLGGPSGRTTWDEGDTG